MQVSLKDINFIVEDKVPRQEIPKSKYHSIIFMRGKKFAEFLCIELMEDWKRDVHHQGRELVRCDTAQYKFTFTPEFQRGVSLDEVLQETNDALSVHVDNHLSASQLSLSYVSFGLGGGIALEGVGRI